MSSPTPVSTPCPERRLSSVPLTFTLGLLLGTAATWLLASGLLAPRSSFTPASATPTPAPITLPPWSWRLSSTPAPLADASIANAIAAWLALRAPDGSPADFTTRADALHALLARLPAAGFPRLLTRLALLATPDDRRLLQSAFDLWVELDPAAAARWAGLVPDSYGLDHLRLARQAALEWARLDALAAATWACALPDEERARDLARAVLPILAEKDPARALALATARGDAFADAVITAVMQSLAQTDPADAILTYGPRLWKNGQGFWKLCGPFYKWIGQDPSSALAWLVAQPRRHDSEVAEWLGRINIDKIDQAVLATTLATVPGLPDRQPIIGRLLSEWATKNPEAALAWLNSLPDGHLRTSLLEQAARFNYTDKPELSLPLALAMPEGANRTNRLAELLGTWAERDPSAALAWMREHDDPGVAAATGSANAAILAAIARDEPATALAEWNALPPGPAKLAAIDPIGTAWASTDPAGALKWLSAQEPALEIMGDPIRDKPLMAWVKKDSLAALRWAESLSEPALRFAYLHSIAGTGYEKAPRSTTADLYAQIKDPALRTQFVTSHVREWLTKDPAGAKTWLESHDALTPAQAAALLAPAK